jgi:hypothetical protein
VCALFIIGVPFSGEAGTVTHVLSLYSLIKKTSITLMDHFDRHFCIMYSTIPCAVMYGKLKRVYVEFIDILTCWSRIP